MVHAIALVNAQRSEVCTVAHQDLLVARRDDLVSGIDETLNDEIIADLPTLMAQGVLPVVDDGSLEALTDAVGDSLLRLADDTIDPSRKALKGLSKLLHTSTILQDDHLLEIARAAVIDPRLTDGVAAFSGLAEMPDRNGFALDSLLYAASRGLAPGDDVSACSGLAEQFSTERLLSTAGFEQAAVAGPAAWVFRVDGNGTILGERYDAKKTALAHGLRLAGEAIEAGAAIDMAVLLEAALGEVSQCADADHPNCYRYSIVDNPVYQLLYAGLEIARYPRPVVFLETWSKLVKENPSLAEQVLVSIGAIIDAAGEGNADTSSADTFRLVEALLPVVARIFRVTTRAGASMPRLLLEVVYELSATAREFPGKLLLSIEHTKLIKANECSANPPDPSSPKVDFAKPRFYPGAGATTVDNRSTLEVSIELLAAADCGSVPFTGGMTVGEAIVDLMSRLTPSTVCNLIDNLLGLLGFAGSVGESLLNVTLSALGCNGANDVRAKDLFALDDLAKSGALDFYLPIARSFGREGQLSALLAVFGVLAGDLRADEDSDPNSRSALRPILPVLADVLRSGAMDPFFDLNDLLVTVPAVDGDGSLADVIIDSGARLVDDTGTIRTSKGPQSGRSLADELLQAAKVIAQRVEQANRTAAASRVFDFVSAYLTETTVDTQGTANPDDDITHLRDQSLVPLIGSLLATATEAARLPAAQYQCYLQEWQAGSGRWVASAAVAAVVRVAALMENYGGRRALESWIAGLLDPSRADMNQRIYDELLRMSAEFLQTPVSIEGVDAVAEYVSTLLYPSPEGRMLVTTLARVFDNDTTHVVQRLVSNGLGPSGSDSADAPFFKVAAVAQDYGAIDSDNQCIAGMPAPDSPESLEESVLSLVSFLHDDDSVLAGLYEILRKRRAP